MDKHELIEKITPLFLRTGYKSLKMDDIADELAMSKKTIYKSFPTKLDLFHRVMENIYPYFEGFLEKYEKDSEHIVDYFYRLKAAIEGVVDINQQRDFFKELEESNAKLYEKTLAIAKHAVFKFAEHTTQKSIDAGTVHEYLDRESINIIFANNYINIKLYVDYESEEQYQQTEKRWFYSHLRGTLNDKGCDMLEDYIKKHPELVS